jgi:hypothetical protein
MPMSEKKTEMIALRVPESIKKQLVKIAERETRSTSQQVEHFVRLGIKEYLKTNPDFKRDS